MKTRIPLLLLSIVSLCGAAPAAEPKPLEFWVNGPTDAKYYTRMVELYRERVAPAFQANIRYYGFTELPDKLAVAIRTGINVPDIVQLDQIFFSIYLGSGQVPFLELSDRIANAGLAEDILPQRMGVFQYDGKTYGLPQSVSAVVLYYRDDLFQQLGIGPSDLETWDKFMETGKRLRNSPTGLLALDWSYFEILLRQRGYSLLEPSGKDNFDDPVVVETLEWLVELARQGVGVIPDRSTIFEPTFFTTDVANDEVAAVIGAEWYGLDMIQNFSPPELEGEWRAMPLPLWTDAQSAPGRDTSSFSGQGLLIFKDSPQPDRAWDFIRFIMQDNDANVQRFLQGNSMPAYRPAWNDPRLHRPEPMFGGQSLGSLIISLAERVPHAEQAPLHAAIINLLREKYWNSLMGGAISPADALLGIRRDLQAFAEK